MELGAGARLSDHVALAAFARAGFFHAGAGVELTLQPGGDWSASGWTFRVAPVALVDALTCFTFDDYSNTCSSAGYLFVEVGPQYRWSSGRRSLSLGGALNLGLVRMQGPRGPSVSPAAGLAAVRVQSEF